MIDFFSTLFYGEKSSDNPGLLVIIKYGSFQGRKRFRGKISWSTPPSKWNTECVYLCHGLSCTLFPSEGSLPTYPSNTPSKARFLWFSTTGSILVKSVLERPTLKWSMIPFLSKEADLCSGYDDNNYCYDDDVIFAFGPENVLSVDTFWNFFNLPIDLLPSISWNTARYFLALLPQYLSNRAYKLLAALT